MKAVTYQKYGAPEVLQLHEVEMPTPKDNEILIKVYATTVTSGDLKLRKADPFIVRFFNGMNKPKNPILGAALAGVVEAAGSQVKGFKKGDRVFGFSAFGAYAEYLTIPEEGAVAKMPANMSFEEAAAVPFGAISALYFLKKGNIQQGQKVLINGASGSVGSFAVQLAKQMGAEVTGVSSTANLDLVRSLGADRVIDYKKEDFSKNSQTYDLIFDAAGKASYPDSKNALEPNGYFISTGFGLSLLLQMLQTSMTGGRKVIMGMASETPEDLDYLRELMENGKIRPVIDKRFSLEEIPDAHRYAESGAKKGNVVITVHQTEAN